MVLKRFYNIEELSTILGKTPAAIYGHLARKQYDAVPPPMKLGRKLAWLVELVDQWIAEKVKDSERDTLQAYMHTQTQQPNRIGRPTKAESIAKRRQAKVGTIQKDEEV